MNNKKEGMRFSDLKGKENIFNLNTLYQHNKDTSQSIKSQKFSSLTFANYRSINDRYDRHHCFSFGIETDQEACGIGSFSSSLSTSNSNPHLLMKEPFCSKINQRNGFDSMDEKSEVLKVKELRNKIRDELNENENKLENWLRLLLNLTEVLNESFEQFLTEVTNIHQLTTTEMEKWKTEFMESNHCQLYGNLLEMETKLKHAEECFKLNPSFKLNEELIKIQKELTVTLNKKGESEFEKFINEEKKFVDFNQLHSLLDDLETNLNSSFRKKISSCSKKTSRLLSFS